MTVDELMERLVAIDQPELDVDIVARIEMETTDLYVRMPVESVSVGVVDRTGAVRVELRPGRVVDFMEHTR